MPDTTGTDNNGLLLHRQLNVQQVGDVTLLDAIWVPDGGNRLVRLFFKAGPAADSFAPGPGVKILQSRSIGEAVHLLCAVSGTQGPVELSLGGAAMKIDAQPPETDLFAGLNVGFAVRNGESVDVTLEWLAIHVADHGMNGALILDRGEPGSDNGFARKLEKKASEIAGLKRLVILDSAVPLGQPDLPPEAHPFNVNGAPGKDRMELPAADPWHAPLGALLIYELARARFLGTARAVANIDVCDLLTPGGDANIFDRACTASTGAIRLLGRQVYPWRVRKGKQAGFGDHICVQFDAANARQRWCVSPARAGENAVWRLIRVVGTDLTSDEIAPFNRYMALRHPTPSVSKIVPKSSLIEDAGLLDQASRVFNHKPVRVPEVKLSKSDDDRAHTTIVTTMKNEGPFILEWIAYHRAIGVSDILVYTNDCTDGTDTLLDVLQDKGFVQHRDNPFRDSGLKPQHAAHKAADKEPVVGDADWLICMDVDEYINIHVGDGRLSDLFGAVGQANMIALTWRLFGNGDIHEFSDVPICEAFTQCAPELVRKPHQAWGFKTLYRNQGIFKKLGVHRPKGLKPQLWEEINWVNGSGAPMPPSMFRNGWRSTASTYGYDLVTLNHYAVRSAESFLVKRDRGRVNHVDRDQGLAYWFRMNNNAEHDASIHRMLPAMRAQLDAMLADPQIAAAHAHCVKMHRAKIDELKGGENYARFYGELTGQRMQRLARMHSHFGANVFLSGPEVVPDEVVDMALPADFFFTVPKGDTNH